MNLRRIILFTILISFSITCVAAENYTVSIDREYGFWALRSDNISHVLQYQGRVLNINTGDTVKWSNEDTYGDRVTINSNNRIWMGDKALGSPGKFYSVTFNTSNSYQIRLVETTAFFGGTTTISNTTYYDEDLEEWINDSVTTPYTVKYYPRHIQYLTVSGEPKGIDEFLIKPTPKLTPKPTLKPVLGNETGTNVTDKNVTITIDDKFKSVMVINKENVITTVKATPTPRKIPIPKPIPVPTPDKIESYQEFTLLHMVSEWYNILKSENISKTLNTIE
jgi:plastocyanin